MTTTYGTCALQMPSNYVVMDAEEMTYVDGGANGFWNARGTVAAIIDKALAVYTCGASLLTLSALKSFLKQNKNKIVYQVKGKIASLFGSSAAIMVAGAIDIALIVSGVGSIGNMIAYGIDYVDGNRLNGYCFG